MKKRPLLFQIVALFLVSMAMSFPLQVMVLYGHPISEIGAVFGKLTYINWACMAALMTLATAAWNGSRWVYGVIPMTVALICWNNFLVGYWGYDYSLLVTSFASIGFGFFCLFPLLPSYANVIQNPHLRWWLVAKRKEVNVPVSIIPFRGIHFQSKTIDLSKTGALIEAKSPDMELGEQIDLNFKINTIQNLQLKAQVVRMNEERKGFGVHFQELSNSQKKLLDKYLQSH